MNNTTTRTTPTVIAAILIAATLVVGGIVATTTTTMIRAAFAYNDDGENGNTLTPQTNRQYGIVSGFDNQQGQEASNLICTNPSEICVQKGFTTGSGSALTPIPGQTGPAGPKGDKSDQGIQGEQGIQGVKGDPGAPCPHTTQLFEEQEGSRRDRVGSLTNSSQLVCIP